MRKCNPLTNFYFSFWTTCCSTQELFLCPGVTPSYAQGPYVVQRIEQGLDGCEAQ